MTIKITIYQWPMDANLHIILPLPRPHSSLYHIHGNLFCWQRTFAVKCQVSVLLFNFASVYSYEYNKGTDRWVLCDDSACWCATKYTPPCSKGMLNWLTLWPHVVSQKRASRAGLYLSAAVFCYPGLGVIRNCTFREK